ncbi:hypothetical protein TWF481_006189 [Arthrobotrys musiformis]|uniref:F-box domain-containing protein n=1 Tax=Arthrobotrys musiformis TaxID=47236 RepID=A0AAV9WHX8_9PEZI
MEHLENNVAPMQNLEEATEQGEATASDLGPIFPTEIEIEIVSHVPFKYWVTIRQVCKRWRAITDLPSIQYLPITEWEPSALDPRFKGVKFGIHKAVYEVVDYLGDMLNVDGFRRPNPRTCQRIKPYLDQPLTIPSLPHTLQDVQLGIEMPPRAERPVRPGYTFKVVPVPCKEVRKLILAPHPMDSNKINITNLNGKEEITGVTVGEFYKSVELRSRVRTGDTYTQILLKWRIRNPTTEWWWKEWDALPGFYELPLAIGDKALEQGKVSHI